MTPSDLRDRWMAEGLHRQQLDPDPFRQFEHWFAQAIDSGIPEPNAMALATVAPSGQPWLRTVLLKHYDREGFVFYTNYGSRKAEQIADNPRVALLFPWVGLARQVKITGVAAKVPALESARYFASRPRGSQIGAWSSAQSQVVSARSLLDAKFEEMKRKFALGEIPLPSFWGGYRVVPDSLEFWQGRSNRLHDRFLYRLVEGGTWHVERLAP